jgi:hypothetical protein
MEGGGGVMNKHVTVIITPFNPLALGEISELFALLRMTDKRRRRKK